MKMMIYIKNVMIIVSYVLKELQVQIIIMKNIYKIIIIFIIKLDKKYQKIIKLIYIMKKIMIHIKNVMKNALNMIQAVID